jgi:hypothetical protein
MPQASRMITTTLRLYSIVISFFLLAVDYILGRVQ